jgi:ribosomal protein S18 acetylase RimI-like enzyme
MRRKIMDRYALEQHNDILNIKRLETKKEAIIISKLDKECFDGTDDLPLEYLLDKQTICYLAYLNDIIVGSIIYEKRSLTLTRIISLCIAPEYRNKSYGTQLIEFVINILKSESCKTVKLYTWKHNLPYYQKLGFKVYDVDKDFYDKGHDMYSLRKDIA